MSGGGIGHGKKPPALFRDQSQPVFDCYWNTPGIGIFNGPGEQDELLAEQSGKRVFASFPTTDPKTVLFESLIEFGFDLLGYHVPFGSIQKDPQQRTIPGQVVFKLSFVFVFIPLEMFRYVDMAFLFGMREVNNKMML
jgi:hypothetical protein